MNRRQFLKNSALATASLSLAPTLARAQVTGANGDIRVAVVGLNSRGKNHLDNFAKQKGVRVVAICDVDSAVLDKISGYAQKEDRERSREAGFDLHLAKPVAYDALRQALSKPPVAIAAVRQN